MSLQQDKEKLEAEWLALENERVYTGWLRKNPQYACDANQQMIFAYLDSELPISETDIDFCVRMIGNKLAIKSAKAVAKTQAEELAERNEAIQKENLRKLALSPAELKAEIRAESQTPAPALPSEWTPETIKAASPDRIRRLNRVYGTDVVNERLGVVKRNYRGISATKGYL